MQHTTRNVVLPEITYQRKMCDYGRFRPNFHSTSRYQSVALFVSCTSSCPSSIVKCTLLDLRIRVVFSLISTLNFRHCDTGIMVPVRWERLGRIGMIEDMNIVLHASPDTLGYDSGDMIDGEVHLNDVAQVMILEAHSNMNPWI